jgi:hypothetical protein
MSPDSDMDVLSALAKPTPGRDCAPAQRENVWKYRRPLCGEVFNYTLEVDHKTLNLHRQVPILSLPILTSCVSRLPHHASNRLLRLWNHDPLG